MSIAAALVPNKAAAGEKEHPKFDLAPAANYPSHQTSEKVTIGASVYDSAEKAKTAFGKLNPYQYGITPVLVVIQNDTGKTIQVDHLRVDYIAPDGSHVDATPAADVRYLRGVNPQQVPNPMPHFKHKNPLDAWEIEGRAFSAKIIPAGESAGGFFYFQTGYQPHSRLYVSGIQESGSGRELLYFEFPLSDDHQ